ncbi:MAG: hypothetical protein Q4D29_12200 [Lachnospiraceae bacterium]|nr:hypothetical protein [Lachnospiraceae bacterium]
MDYQTALTELTTRYSMILDSEGYPLNSWDKDGDKIVPAVPFIGKKYFEQPKGQRVLAYASAENLTWVDRSQIDKAYYCSKAGLRRSRDFYENPEKNHEVFPFIHIQPFNDGGLLIAVNRIMRNLFGTDYKDTPQEFIERICCANFGKFSIRDTEHPNRNKDYAGNYEILKLMLSYIKADIDTLKPDYIIMPATMYKGKVKESLTQLISEDRVIGIMQINATNVNCHIAKKHLPVENLTEIENTWLNALKRMNHDSFKSVYTYVDEIVQRYK